MSVAFVRPVEVSAAGFAFCRWSLAVALWVAALAGEPWLVAATAVVLGASAIAGVERAPMIVLWRLTAGRLRGSASVVLDARAMRFAHALGAALCGAAWALGRVAPRAGLVAAVALAVLKTAGALGYCTASRLHACLAEGACCRRGRSCRG